MRKKTLQPSAPPLPRYPPPQFTFLQDDWGIPLNYRHMEGFGVHTFKLVNAAGKETFVKFHWKPSCGESLGVELGLGLARLDWVGNSNTVCHPTTSSTNSVCDNVHSISHIPRCQVPA